MRRLILPLMVFAAVGLVLSIIGLVSVLRAPAPPSAEPRASTQDAHLTGLAIPPFTMTDQDGKEQTQAILDGRVTVVTFIFTHCPFACPMMTAAMHEVAAALTDTPVRFLSISVDPTRDTPRRLAQYAQNNAIDTTRWTLLTGTQATIDAVLKEALGFALQPDPAQKITLPDGTQMDNIIHPTKLLLVGPDRKVLGFYESARPEDTPLLARRARQAARELGLMPRRAGG